MLRKKFGIWVPRLIGCAFGLYAFLHLFMVALILNPPFGDIDVKADWLGSAVVALILGYAAYVISRVVLSTVYGVLKWEYPGAPLF